VAGGELQRITVIALAVATLFVFRKHDNHIGMRSRLDNFLDGGQ
jgi:hypothetical protein